MNEWHCESDGTREPKMWSLSCRICMNLEWLGRTLFWRLWPSCAKASNHRTFLQPLGASSQPSDPHGHLPQWTCRRWKPNTSLFTHRIAKDLRKGLWPSMLSLWPLDEITWCRRDVEQRSELKRTEIGREPTFAQSDGGLSQLSRLSKLGLQERDGFIATGLLHQGSLAEFTCSQLFSQRLVDICRSPAIVLKACLSFFDVFWPSGLSGVKSFKLFCQIFLLHPYMSNRHGSFSQHVFRCVQCAYIIIYIHIYIYI